MVGMGMGGILSNAAAGWLLEHEGPAAPYAVGGVVGLTCGVLMLWLLPLPERPLGSEPHARAGAEPAPRPTSFPPSPPA